MANIHESFKGISNQIQSQVSERDYKGHKIPKHIFDKYLKIGNQDIFDKLDDIALKIKPVWEISLPQTINNMKGVFSSSWPFSQQNKSIYYVIWGPISLIFFVYLLHSSPYQNKFLVFSSGLIHLWLILIQGYIGYVFSNILKFPFVNLFEHLCISSHVNLITIVYCCVCTGAPEAIIIILTIVYIALMTYLHFNIYNRALKPSMLEFIILFTLILLVYLGSAILQYQTFTSKQAQIKQVTIEVKNQHYQQLRIFQPRQ